MGYFFFTYVVYLHLYSIYGTEDFIFLTSFCVYICCGYSTTTTTTSLISKKIQISYTFPHPISMAAILFPRIIMPIYADPETSTIVRGAITTAGPPIVFFSFYTWQRLCSKSLKREFGDKITNPKYTCLPLVFIAIYWSRVRLEMIFLLFALTLMFFFKHTGSYLWKCSDESGSWILDHRESSASTHSNTSFVYTVRLQKN